ncbi:hypothetical protein AMTRI_Chr06g197510 [Amborella trichopoda]
MFSPIFRPSHFQALSLYPLSVSLSLVFEAFLWFLKHSFFKHCKWPKYLVKKFLRILPSVEVRFREMAEEGGLPKWKVDEEEDGADAVQKRRRISGSNFYEDRLQVVLVSPSQEEQDQAKNQEIEVARAKKEQDRAKIYQEICEIMAQKDNQVITQEDFLRNMELEHGRSTSRQSSRRRGRRRCSVNERKQQGQGKKDLCDLLPGNTFFSFFFHPFLLAKDHLQVVFIIIR